MSSQYPLLRMAAEIHLHVAKFGDYSAQLLHGEIMTVLRKGSTLLQYPWSSPGGRL